MKTTRIWCISDTHGFHQQLIKPDNIDIVLHTGDESNSKHGLVNLNELEDFLSWYDALDIKHKVFIAGNHSTAIERGYYDKHSFRELGIVYLEHQTVTIEGIKIFGSPYTPSFGVGWAYNKDRGKLAEYWKEIEPDTDIIAVHGPPYGMLDLSYNMMNQLEYCGCKALAKRIKELHTPYCVFGHIHNMDGVINQGERIHNGTTYVNASCVEDGRFDKGATSNGVIIEITKDDTKKTNT